MKKYIIKIKYLLISIISFSIIYLFFNNHHFIGLNKVQDKLTDEKMEEKTDEITNKLESFSNINNNYEDKIEKNIEKIAENEKTKIQRPNILQNLFDRLYFSVITACLVGYGDIYPATNIMKFIVSLQTFTTLCLILY